MEPDAAVPTFSMPPIPTRSDPLGDWFRNALQTMNQNASKYNKDKAKSRRENSRTLAGILDAPPRGAYGGPYATTWPQLPIGAGTGVLDNLGGGRTRRASKEADRAASGFLNDIVPGLSSAIASAANNAVDYGASAMGGMRGAAQAAIDTPGMIPDGSLYTGEELRRQLEATSGSIIPPGLRPVPQQQVEANARQARVDEFNREASRDQAYRDALNTRFQGQNMDGTTFDRLPTDSEAQALAASSFRNSGRQVMPRITTNSTFPGQVNPNVGRATVADPYGGPNQYAWQGREASYGNRTYRSVTRDPRTGQTTIDNFSTPGNAFAPQSRGLSPTVDPVTGATVEAPQVRAAQQAVMDQIRRRAELRSSANPPTESEIASAVPYNRNRQTWQNVANTMGIPTHRANASGRLDLIPEQERRAMMREAARQETQNKYASDRAAWGNIIANRQAQNAGFANAYQAEMFRQIALANANRGQQPLINVQQGGPPQPAMNGAAAPVQAPAQAARPLGVRGTNPGGLPDDQFSEVQQIRQNRSPQDVFQYLRRNGHGDIAINQVLYNLYPGERRSASQSGEPLPFGLGVRPDGTEGYGAYDHAYTSFPLTHYLAGGWRSLLGTGFSSVQQPTDTYVPGTRLTRPLRGIYPTAPTAPTGR